MTRQTVLAGITLSVLALSAQANNQARMERLQECVGYANTFTTVLDWRLLGKTRTDFAERYQGLYDTSPQIREIVELAFSMDTRSVDNQSSRHLDAFRADAREEAMQQCLSKKSVEATLVKRD